MRACCAWGSQAKKPSRDSKKKGISMQDQCWFVPPGSTTLISPYEADPGPRAVVAAQPFTVSLRTVFPQQDLDGFLRGRNDILITSTTTVGDKPGVERVHFYQDEVKAGVALRNFIANTIYLTDDYNGEDDITIDLRVADVDIANKERAAVIQAITSLGTAVGAVFPVALPYTFGASVVGKALNALVSSLEGADDAVLGKLTFTPSGFSLGRVPLQQGAYIIFQTPVNPDTFRLEPNGEITEKGKKPSLSYIVFVIELKKRPSPEFVISQKVATLLTQLKNGNDNNPAVPTIQFLVDTLTQYASFEKVKRYMALADKKNRTKEESDLMADIEKNEAIRPFLPKAN